MNHIKSNTNDTDNIKNTHNTNNTNDQTTGKPTYLYHGSPTYHETLIPHQAYDIGFEAGCQNAVYATTSKVMAICFALGAVPDENGEVEREMMPEYGDKIIFKKGTPNYGGKGYIYILDGSTFTHAMGTQYVCFDEVKPIEIIEINVDDYLNYCEILKQGDLTHETT